MRPLLLPTLVALSCLGLAACSDKKETRDDTTAVTTNTSEASLPDRMAKEHQGDTPTPNEASTTAPAQPVQGTQVSYVTLEGTPVQGYLAKPKNMPPGTNAPGLIVIHEWWGLNDNIKKMTDRLAGEGYVALAVDMYQGEVGTTPDQAKALMMKSMGKKEILGQNIQGAIAYLQETEKVSSLGSIGWCFGGGWSLQSELIAPDKIDATVIYYGRVQLEQDQLKPINSPILGIFGAEDQGIPVASVKTFETNLNALQKNASIHIYEGANHAFANPSGTHYAPKAAQDAWQKTTAFFATHLKKEKP